MEAFASVGELSEEIAERYETILQKVDRYL